MLVAVPAAPGGVPWPPATSAIAGGLDVSTVPPDPPGPGTPAPPRAEAVRLPRARRWWSPGPSRRGRRSRARGPLRARTRGTGDAPQPQCHHAPSPGAGTTARGESGPVRGGGGDSDVRAQRSADTTPLPVIDPVTSIATTPPTAPSHTGPVTAAGDIAVGGDLHDLRRARAAGRIAVAEPAIGAGSPHRQPAAGGARPGVAWDR